MLSSLPVFECTGREKNIHARGLHSVYILFNKYTIMP